MQFEFVTVGWHSRVIKDISNTNTCMFSWTSVFLGTFRITVVYRANYTHTAKYLV